MTSERISLRDSSLIAAYAENIQRYDFALQYSRDKRVLDAGCGTGYGAQYLALNGARSVLAVDISSDAISEATANYRSENLCYEPRDIEMLEDDPALRDQFDVVVNFENIAHLMHPERMVKGVSTLLPKEGTFIISTPNGDISALDEHGAPVYKFHHRVYASSDLMSLVSPHFSRVSMYGQWLTHAGMLRKVRAKELFDQTCEAYYNPMSRFGRVLSRLLGRRAARLPQFTGAADSFPGDYEIRSLESNAYPWPPTVLLAVCEK